MSSPFCITSLTLPRNDFDEYLVPGEKDRWETKKPPKNWLPNDRLFFWESSPSRCLIGLGRLDKILPKDINGFTFFDLTYLTYPFENPIFIEELRKEKTLRDASFLKSGPAITVFPITETQAKKTYEIILSRNAINDLWNDLISISNDNQETIDYIANDISEPPERANVIVSRIIRDTLKAKRLKALYNYCCQICGLRIELSNNNFYIEVHHVRPLGGKHKGMDDENNMIVLCPNHHAMFDFGIPIFISKDEIRIGNKTSTINRKHNIDETNIEYHNNEIHGRI